MKKATSKRKKIYGTQHLSNASKTENEQKVLP